MAPGKKTTHHWFTAYQDIADCVIRWGHNNMKDILQTTYWNALSWQKIFAFLIKFHWSLFPRVCLSVMPQSHPTMGPVLFLSYVWFLARKAEWSACRNFKSVLFSWSHQARGPIRLDTAVCFWFGWIIRRALRVSHAMPLQASYGPRTGIFNVFHILRDPYGANVWPARVPYRALMDT